MKTDNNYQIEIFGLQTDLDEKELYKIIHEQLIYLHRKGIAKSKDLFIQVYNGNGSRYTKHGVVKI